MLNRRIEFFKSLEIIGNTLRELIDIVDGIYEETNSQEWHDFEESHEWISVLYGCEFNRSGFPILTDEMLDFIDEFSNDDLASLDYEALGIEK